MNFEAGDIFVYLTFKNPTDVNEETGSYKFIGPDDSAFSGIWRVTSSESEFSNGNFTQVLTGVRLIGQDIEYNATSISGPKGNTELLNFDKNFVEPSSPTDPPT